MLATCNVNSMLGTITFISSSERAEEPRKRLPLSEPPICPPLTRYQRQPSVLPVSWHGRP